MSNHTLPNGKKPQNPKGGDRRKPAKERTVMTFPGGGPVRASSGGKVEHEKNRGTFPREREKREETKTPSCLSKTDCGTGVGTKQTKVENLPLVPLVQTKQGNRDRVRGEQQTIKKAFPTNLHGRGKNKTAKLRPQKNRKG